MKIRVHVKTGKKVTKVIKIEDFGYEVWVRSRPRKGSANKELIEVISEHFNIRPNKVRIVRGFKSGKKIVEIIE